MNILQVVPRVKDQSSGPSYSVTRLCSSLHDRGQNVALHVLEPGSAATQSYSLHAHACSHFPGAWRVGWSPDMKRELELAARQMDIVHNHSMWMMPNIYSYQAAKKAGCRFVFSPRGTLSAWALDRARLRKKLVWWYGQKAALQGADCLHATSEMELQEIRKLGIRKPVAVIPNGIDIPGLGCGEADISDRRKLVFLSRIHPKKGLETLLNAWQAIQGTFKDWDLLIVGPLKGSYAGSIQEFAARLKVERVSFTGEAIGEKKHTVLLQADLFVLPTHSENFGIVVAEALAHGTPVVVTKGAPWSGVEANGCGWWIDHGDDALQTTLIQAMQLPPGQLAAMGQRGRSWMERDYSWGQVGEKMHQTYRWLLNDSSKPDWIETYSR